MPIQSGTFKRLPAKDEILEQIREERRHNADLTSYMWYIMPVAEEFGDQVFDVAAKSLTENDLRVTPAELKDLAEELSTSEGKKRYAEQRRLHLFNHVTG